MNLQQTVSEILKRKVTIEEAKDFAANQFGVLATYLKQKMNSWIEQLMPIVLEYRDSNEPLDGDEVDDLCKIIKAKINLLEGNITEEEYEKILG